MQKIGDMEQRPGVLLICFGLFTQKYSCSLELFGRN